MRLHEDKEQFRNLINAVFEDTGIRGELVEKDYYVTLFLKELAAREPLFVFKGGTCLSKCYKLIQRFSEDIDVNLTDVNSLSQGRKKKLRDNIVDTVNALGLKHTNPDEIKSGRSYNTYFIDYPTVLPNRESTQHLLVETMLLVDPYPIQKSQASSLICDYLAGHGHDAVIRQYGLEPFDVTVQSLERTFVDKIFALGTHYMDGRIKRQSRHLYDLYKILPHIKIDSQMRELFDKVRLSWKNRKGQYDRTAAEDAEDLPKLLKEFIDNDAFYEDYERLTKPLLYEDVAYAETITALRKIISELEGGAER